MNYLKFQFNINYHRLRHLGYFIEKYKIANCLIYVFLTIFFGCANVGTPSGGPKDIKPPGIVLCTPANKSVNFSKGEIAIEFDEFIKLKGLDQELLISPPLKEKPIIRIRNKSLDINLNGNDLKPNTTYTFNFGNSIADLNEGNILNDFEYVFSTGNQIDTLSVTGKVLSAYDHKPSPENEKVEILLYKNLADSAPLKEIPQYITKANKFGLFSINNIHPDTYRIIALKDLNNNMHYDPPGESIAYLDSFLIISPQTVKSVNFIKDTIKITTPEKKSSKGIKVTSVKTLADTTIKQGKKLNAVNTSLFMFQEEPDRVYLSGKSRESAEELIFTFNREPYDSVTIRPLNFKPSKNWFVMEHSIKNDTLIYWITDSIISKRDTLSLLLSYLTPDSSKNLYIKSDTVNMKYRSMPLKSTLKHGKTAEIKKNVGFKISTNILNNSMADLNSPVIVTANKPIGEIDDKQIEFLNIQDSIKLIQPFILNKDSLNPRRLNLTTSWEEENKYTLTFKPGAIKDVFGYKNDTLVIHFTIQKLEFYGSIIVTINEGKFPIILQLLNEKELIIREKYLFNPQKITFRYLTPAKYTIKAIYDLNGNGKWDTGNYLKHTQPEPVFFYNMPVELRSNWDYDVNWQISD